MNTTKNDILQRICSGAYEERCPEPDEKYLPSYEQDRARYEAAEAAWRRDVEEALCPPAATPRLRVIIWERACFNVPHMEPKTRRRVFLEAYENAVRHVRVIVQETGGHL